jgi:DNA polymerase-3 subunit delta
MVVLREEEFESHLKRRISSSNGILIHGNDEAAVSLLSRQAAKAIAEAMRRVDVTAAKASPGTFMDDFLSLSLLGDRQVLLVDGADEYCLKFLEPAFAYEQPANFVIVLANSLGKASKLRAGAETSAQFSSLAVYDEDEARLALRVRKFLEAHGLRWGPDAEAAFFVATGADRAMAMQEVEKLALYVLGNSEIAEADVLAICGNASEYNSDELIDAVLRGNLEETDRIVSQLGAETRNLLPLVQLHLNTLQNLRAQVERGSTAEAALAAAKPPIFFKRKPALLDQLRKFAMKDLLEIQEAFSSAIFQSRKQADLGETTINRTLLAIARLARSKSN